MTGTKCKRCGGIEVPDAKKHRERCVYWRAAEYAKTVKGRRQIDIYEAFLKGAQWWQGIAWLNSRGF